MTQAPEQSTAKGWRPDDSTFGARLALVRQRMGWGNTAEAARACGIPTESWRTWERDGVVPRRIVEMAGLIADASGCDYDWLLRGPRRQSGREVGSRTTHGYSTVTERPPAHIDRPRDNRPSARPVSAPPATVGRTAYVARASRRRRDR